MKHTFDNVISSMSRKINDKIDEIYHELRLKIEEKHTNTEEISQLSKDLDMKVLVLFLSLIRIPTAGQIRHSTWIQFGIKIR